MKIEDTEAFGW